MRCRGTRGTATNVSHAVETSGRPPFLRLHGSHGDVVWFGSCRLSQCSIAQILCYKEKKRASGSPGNWRWNLITLHFHCARTSPLPPHGKNGDLGKPVRSSWFLAGGGETQGDGGERRSQELATNSSPDTHPGMDQADARRARKGSLNGGRLATDPLVLPSGRAPARAGKRQTKPLPGPGPGRGEQTTALRVPPRFLMPAGRYRGNRPARAQATRLGLPPPTAPQPGSSEERRADKGVAPI